MIKAGSTRTNTRRRLALFGSITAVAMAGLAFAAPGPAHAASLDVSVSPTQPSYADKYSVNYTFDANDFPTDHAGLRYAWIRIILIPADAISDDGPGCASTEAGSAEIAYRGANEGGFETASWLISDLYSGHSEMPLSGTFRTVNNSRIPEGDYILCGYLYDADNNPQAPDPVQIGGEHGGIPDVGPVAHPFTVRPARATVSLSVSPSSVVGAGERVTLTAPWSGEAGYTDEGFVWNGPGLDVFMFPDHGQTCPADVPDELGDSEIALASESIMFDMDGPRDATDPERIDRGTATMKVRVNQPAGRYLLCAYMSRTFFNEEEGQPEVATVFTEARSNPARLRISNGNGGQSPNQFALGNLKRNLKQGTARLAVKVPGAGRVRLAKTKQVRGAKTRAKKAGGVRLPVRPRGKAKRQLRKRGKAVVRARVTYRPDGAKASTESRKVRLVRK